MKAAVKRVDGHVVARGAWDGQRVRLDDVVLFNAQAKKLGLIEGEAIVVRVEREADAKRHHQLKWYFGYVVKPCVEKTGYTVREMDAIFRALFMPEGVETLSLMSFEQMDEFNREAERYAVEVIEVEIKGPRDLAMSA